MDEHRAGVPAPRIPAAGIGVTGEGFGRQLDEFDRKIIVALQQDGRASWTAIAEETGGAVSTVARRGQQLLADGIVSVGIVPTLGSEGHVENFLIRINTTPGRQVEVAEQLVASPDVRFVTLVTGRYDIFAEVVISGSPSTYPHVLGDLQAIPGVERWRSDLLTHTYKISFDWGRQLFEEHATAQSTRSFMPSPNTCDPSHFDEADRRIIAELQRDGRESFQSIGDKLGMNESSVRRRYDRLKANGCLTTVTTVPATALGMSAETFMQVRVAPSRLNSVAKQLAEHVAVRFLAAGLDENSLYCEIILPSTATLHEFITGVIGQLDGVKGWSAAMELVFLKRGFIETPWWRSQLAEAPIALAGA